MQTATQILAQRAPATRTKPRWQPYTSTRSPITTCLSIQSKAQSPAPITPSTSTSQINQPQIDSNLTPATDTQPLKDGNKHKFSIGLIDQAVKTLSEIWRPQDIPRVFLAPTKIGPAGLSLSHSTPSIPSSSSSHRTPTPLGAHSSAPQVLLAIADESDSNLLPIRSFVHEVLKRSRTSGSILQAALCYLEAIRTKVPEILEQERNGIRAQFEPESRIILATEEELKAEADMPSGSCFSDDSETIKTIRVSDYDYEDHGRSEPLLHPSAPNQASPMFALPSPLLCPRRAFLASLILASKFFQDKCYSNRAWAKLSGLPPREISRCERALGQVLEWRLWVGKKPVATPTTPPPLPAVHRTMSRSHSEGTISVSSIATTSFLAPSETINRVSASLHISPDATAKGLRRSSTLPDVYATSAAGVSGNVAPIPSIIVESTEDVLMYSSLSMSSHGQLQPIPQTTSSATPSPDTPTLTYSPTSTESSSLDSQISQHDEKAYFTTLDGTRSWVESQPTSFGLGLDIKEAWSHLPNSGNSIPITLSKESRKPFDLRRSVMIAVASADSPDYTTPCLWHPEDSGCLREVYATRQ